MGVQNSLVGYAQEVDGMASKTFHKFGVSTDPTPAIVPGPDAQLFRGKETRFLTRDAGGLSLPGTKGALNANGRLRPATRPSRWAWNAGSKCRFFASPARAIAFAGMRAVGEGCWGREALAQKEGIGRGVARLVGVVRKKGALTQRFLVGAILPPKSAPVSAGNFDTGPLGPFLWGVQNSPPVILCGAVDHPDRMADQGWCQDAAGRGWSSYF